MGSATNKSDQHFRYESQYPALNSPAGLRILLSDLHALRQRRFQGDTAASDVLIDLATAIEAAKLTVRQRQALRLVYEEDLTQEDAGRAMGLDKQGVNNLLDRALEGIAEIYWYWSAHGEGYCVGHTKGETE
jgi:DNA-directed RNA polymerase specialized sigma24 family protein